jgi:hypothetical protein
MPSEDEACRQTDGSLHLQKTGMTEKVNFLFFTKFSKKKEEQK